MARSIQNRMAYEYDVFFSYKRDAESDEWHRRVMEKLLYWLKHELNTINVRVFFDTEEIRTGARWQNKICGALKASKTMVCVWSPLYFQSPWCVSEWKTFSAREARYGRDLLVPASYHDGACFPEEAKAKQMQDLSDFTSTAARFWETDGAVAFEQKVLKPLARDIAAAVRAAPPFDPDFPLVVTAENSLPDPPVIGRIADV